jgi:hypothetical protein
VGKIRIAYRNWIREPGALVFAESAAIGGRGLKWTAVESPSERWISAEPAFGTWNLGTARLLRLLAVLHTTAAAAAGAEAQRRWRAGNDGAAWIEDSGTGNLPPQAGLDRWRSYHSVYIPDPAVWATPRQYVRLDITDTPASEVRVGNLYIADPFVPAKNIDSGWTLTPEGQSQESSAQGAVYFRAKLPTRWILRFSMTWVREAEAWDTLHDMDRVLGSSGGVLIVLDPDAAHPNQTTVYGYQDLGESYISSPLVKMDGYSGVAFRKTWVVREMAPR